MLRGLEWRVIQSTICSCSKAQLTFAHLKNAVTWRAFYRRFYLMAAVSAHLSRLTCPYSISVLEWFTDYPLGAVYFSDRFPDRDLGPDPAQGVVVLTAGREAGVETVTHAVEARARVVPGADLHGAADPSLDRKATRMMGSWRASWRCFFRGCCWRENCHGVTCCI